MSLHGRIEKYCKSLVPRISMRYLSEITGASYSQIKELNLHPDRNTTVEVINKLYVGTKKVFPNNPLTPDLYLDYELFKIDEDSED